MSDAKLFEIHLASAYCQVKKQSITADERLTHLLSPSGSSVVPVIEEGLATVNSESYIARELNYFYQTPEVPYATAAALVRDIAKLRSVEPAFTTLTNQTFIEAGVEAPVSLIDKLPSPLSNS